MSELKHRDLVVAAHSNAKFMLVYTTRTACANHATSGSRRYNPGMPTARPPLGGLTASRFLREYWQKRPLLVRQALPRFAGLIDRRTMFSLAARDDVESRLVARARGTWRVTQGPLVSNNLRRLPARNWTLLVNGVNTLDPAADALLRRFAFVPYARIDDLMVSYATDGGGVGPHVDSYDVFLLQGPGRRRWRLMPPAPQRQPFRMRQDVPLKLIADFHPSVELILEAGDMLYLPPGWGHDGVALGASFTYSIGFRAPRGTELGVAFLDFLHERGLPESAYRDPDRRPVRHPALLDRSMIAYATRTLARIRWSRSEVAEFLGRYLSEPKPHVLFAPPPRPVAFSAFLRRLANDRVQLDPRTNLLVHGTKLFVNGDALTVRGRARAALLALADRRSADGAVLAHARLADLLYTWYRQGYLGLERRQ